MYFAEKVFEMVMITSLLPSPPPHHHASSPSHWLREQKSKKKHAVSAVVPGAAAQWLAGCEAVCLSQLPLHSDDILMKIYYLFRYFYLFILLQNVNHGGKNNHRISFLRQQLPVFRGCEVNKYSLCINHSWFHQHQLAWLCMFSLAVLTLRVSGHNDHSLSPHCLWLRVLWSREGKGGGTWGILCDLGTPGALAGFLFVSSYQACPLPGFWAFDQMHWGFASWSSFLGFPSDLKWNLVFSKEGYWPYVFQVSKGNNAYLKYEPAHDWLDSRIDLHLEQ